MIWHLLRRRGFSAGALAAVVLSVLAWSAPRGATGEVAKAAECTFALRASNNLSFDVWVQLYDSHVTRLGMWGSHDQLKIQNHRIASGKSMDRRYTAAGRCKAERRWLIVVKRGSTPFEVEIYTSGESSDSRTVDIGPSSRWKPA